MAPAAAKQSKKLRILVMPFFATSHILPLTDLAFHLAVVRPNDVEVIVAVTTANAPIVRSALARRELPSHASVEVATYAFPEVDGLPWGVENMSTVKPEDSTRLEMAATNEALMRPAQESLIREISPDAIVSDLHFFGWNAGIAFQLGISCVLFNVVGIFPTLATWRLALSGNVKDAPPGSSVTVPQLPGPEISLPVTELSEFLRNPPVFDDETGAQYMMLLKSCGFVSNTFFDLEREYCESYEDSGYTKRTYCVGPLALPMPPPARAGSGRPACLDWLDTMPTHSVVYLCFGSLTNFSEAQLDELALGLEASEVPFLWVIRVKTWEPPVGWKDRVGKRGGVPVLTWPMVFEQFITERFVTHVLRIGERLWPEGAGRRSTRSAEHDVVPGKAIAQSVAKFMENGGAAEAARRRVMELSPKAHAAMAEGGTSYRDLHQLIDDFIAARASVAGAATS
ncbi:hypothetical protein HU200_018325 [Digitaria exilis]|uniref:Glycosyltransferase n=1 Tax=Digitaria exilis TaxID=1010633 RepID=A0A835KGW9_9POAL|nr:hypothetical protein HU200_018325 [Digitaria exilis]